MKKKLSSKKCIALILAAVMIITSIPFMMVGALTYGAYDPAPYWGDDPTDKYGAINTNFVATLNTDGSVDISFPNANAQKTYDGSSTKTVVKYVFTLTKLQEDGSRREIWSDVFDATKSYINANSGGVFTITEGAKYPNNIYYAPGGLVGLEGYDTAAKYDCSIMAIDSDGWFSDKIHTLLSDVPYYNMSTDFSPNELWISRTLLDFETAGSAEFYGGGQSSNGAAGSTYSQVSTDQTQIDYLYNVNGLVEANGQMAGTGYNNSNSYRFWFSGNYTDTSFMFDSIWSRQHYDFTLQGVDNYDNAEVWFYVDFTRVDIGKTAFHLRANEKYQVHWRSGKDDDTKSQYGTLFSTKAVKDIYDINSDGNTDDYINGGVQKGVYIQNAEGLWEETTMTNGYVTNLAGYKGFIRIPISYFVLQEDQYITTDNVLESDKWGGNTVSSSDLDNYVNGHMYLQNKYSTLTFNAFDGSTQTAEKVSLQFKQRDEKESAWTYPTKDVYKIIVNKVGTPVTDSLIVYERYEKATLGGTYIPIIGVVGGSEATRDSGYMLHPGTTTTISGTHLNIDRENGVMAINDIASAGFEVADWSTDSLHKSFYLDKVLVCQKVDESKQSQIVYDTDPTSTTYGRVADSSAVKFTGESGFADDYGYVVKSYYDRTVEVPKVVAEYILEYVGKIPSLDDVNTIEQIDEIITTYMDCFPNCSTVQDAIEYLKSDAIGQVEAYNRYTTAKGFITEYINKEGEANKNYNAVTTFEAGVELLPSAEFADYSDENLRDQLEFLMALYKSFNLSHFEILGAEAEEKFLTIYSIMMGEEVKTGYSIGAYPYIPFNDFETNYTYGQLSQMYYDDYPAREDSKATDVNSTKNFVTYVADGVIDQLGAISGIARGWSPMDYRPTGETLGEEGAKYFSRMDAIISNKGFDNSQGATIRLNGDLNSLGSNWKTATLSTTYLGQNVNNWSELKGLDLSALSVSTAIDTTAGSEAFDSQNTGRYGDGVKPNSFVMYVDFTDVTDICMNIKFIVEDASGNDGNCYFCGGAQDRNPIIYLLDDKGDWVEQKLEVTQTDLDANASFKKELRGELTPVICSISPSSTNSLEGYKGFIRIPLTNFRIRVLNGVSEDYLCLDDELENYTIKQAKVTFWDETGANVDKEINIDAMGFTYDPACQTRTSSDVVTELNSDNGITVKNMDEYFGVKTNDSVTVEKMIAEIDPYVGRDQFIADCNAVVEAYNKLSPYQKQLKEVDTAYNDLFYNKYLALYQDYDNLIAQEPWVAKYATASELLTDLNALDSKATSFDITSKDNALVKPYDTDIGIINYTDLGIADKAEAERIVEMYEKGYMRLSNTEKGNVSADDLTKLENAYNAANRLLLLEDYIADMNSFKNEIIQIYTVGTAEPDVRMVSYANPDLLEAIEHYEDMSVFAKQMLSTTKDTANAGYPNMYAAAEAIYDNSHTITTSNGTTIDGGVLVFEERMHTCATDVAEKIRTRTVLDDATLNEIEYCLGQTESFLQRYAQVDEINVAYHELADLLPVADIASVDSSNAELTKITLNNDSAETMKCTAYIDLSYIATRLNRSVDLYAQSSLKWTQTGGSTYNAFEDLMYNSATAESLADYQNADGIVTALVGSYTNGNSASLEKYPYEISVDATEAAKVPTGATYTGKVTFYAVDSAVVAEKTADGTDISTVLADAENVLEVIEVDVVFQSTNGTDPIIYEVEIPAKVQVAWDTTDAVDVSYSVEATLGSNTLSVGVSGTDKLINDDTRVTYELAYSKANFVTETFTGDVATGTKPTNAPSITITDWDSVPVGVYSTQLTYTVDVTSS